MGLFALVLSLPMQAQTIRTIAAGSDHCLTLRSDSTLWAWGSNNFGQLGIGNNTLQNCAVQIGTGRTWTAIATMDYHNLALRSDGTLWAWGRNTDGQLGTGNTDAQTSPVQIGTGTTWKTVAVGRFSSFAIKNDGTLWAWGDNTRGQLGIGNTTNQLTPVQVGTDNNWMQINHYESHVVALKTDSTLWAWGQNTFGQHGNGTTTATTSPVRIGTGTTWKAVVAGGSGVSFALKSDGTLWAAGRNFFGNLGNGNKTQQTSLVQIGTATTWTAVRLGNGHTLALRSDGSIWAWGDNTNGQLGNGTTTEELSPIQVGTGATWTQISAGYNNSYALKSDGTLWAWGSNSFGKLGNGNQTQQNSPVLSVCCVTPSVFSVTGGGGFCTGSTGVAVGLANSEMGVTYQLKNGTNNVGSAVAGTGAAISFGNQTTAATYTVVATRTTGGCTANMTGNAVVSVNPTATATESMTWRGTVSTSWNDPCNWSPNGLPTATNQVVINDVANDPVILSGTTAVAKEIYINANGSLKVNSGGTLNVNVTVVTNCIIFQGANSSLTNDGTINLGTSTENCLVAEATATVTNRGTISTSPNGSGVWASRSDNFTFINEATGVYNGNFRAVSTLNLTNRGTINHFVGGNFALSFSSTSSLVNEGIIRISSGAGISNPTGSTITNAVCGRIVLTAGSYVNGGTTTNAGLIVTLSVNNTNGTFNNTGVTNRLPTVGTVTNTGNGAVQVRDLTYPYFVYGGTFNGTINGIFTDSSATISAGTFTAPQTFVPLTTLLRAEQTLYVRITPSGGACAYVVPLKYNPLRSSVLTIDASFLDLQQNRPNPFSQETSISFVLAETGKANLTVYDLTGRQVFTIQKVFNAGNNEVKLDKSLFSATGTYFYRLTSEKYVAVKKLQFVAE